MLRILEPGDRFPDLVLPDASGQRVHLYARVGGRPVLLLLWREPGPDVDALAIQFSEACDVVTISSRAIASAEYAFVDGDGKVLDAHLGERSRGVYVLDANLRVLKSIMEAEPADRIADALRSITDTSPRDIRCQAPVLTVERVLAPERCQFLMQLWEKGGSVETGVEQSTSHGRTEVLSGLQKSRRDHTVDDPKLIQLLTQSIGKRLLPEIERAFIYRPSRFEGFKIACYDAVSSGFFGAHRDNLSPNTAHRRLAVSLCLNDGYSGGELRFPEFGLDRYCPSAGSALVFSCAHLHEVLPVTEGKRFTLLTFLYDETAKRRVAVDPFAV